MKLEIQRTEDGGFFVKRKKRIRVIAKASTDAETASTLGKVVVSIIDSEKDDDVNEDESETVENGDDEEEGVGRTGDILDDLSERAVAKVATELFGMMRKFSRSKKKKNEPITTEASEPGAKKGKEEDG